MVDGPAVQLVDTDFFMRSCSIMSTQQTAANRGPGPDVVDEDQPALLTRMQALLTSLGVEDIEPRAVNQLIDYVYRYVTDVLLDADSYSGHAGKPAGQVDLDNVMLAIQARSAYTFAQPPSLDEISSLAALVNDKELPKFPANRMGLLIPDDKDCLTAQNYQLNT